MELASSPRLSGFSYLAVFWCCFLTLTASSSESASDCSSASKTLSAGLEAQPDNALALFLDALQTSPGCRKGLLVTAIENFPDEPKQIERFIFIARQEFPGDQTELAGVALQAAPEHIDVIRSAFLAGAGEMEAALAKPDKPGKHLVELPPEAQALDEDLREAIARMTAKVEGKYWPEQDLKGPPPEFKNRDKIRVSRQSRSADETSLENAIPIDQTDEREISTPQLRINDHWEKEDTIRLDESKFVSEDQGDSRAMQEARKREIAPAGAVALPKRPLIRRPSYYIPPAAGDFRSTIDLDEEARPKLIIRPPSAFRTIPADQKSE